VHHGNGTQSMFYERDDVLFVSLHQEGCFPPGVSKNDKYWSPVGRVDNVYGDRNLVCSCPPVSDYAQAAE